MTNTIQPKTWEGNFALAEKKAGSGVFTIAPRQSGKFSSECLAEAIKAMLGAPRGTKFDGWKFWLDGDFTMELAKGADVTQATLAKIVKEADDVQLAFVKRPFPQPKLKFTKGEGNGPVRKAKANAPREL